MKVNISSVDSDYHSVKMESDERRKHSDSPLWVAEMNLPLQDVRDLCDALAIYLSQVDEAEAIRTGTSAHSDVTGGFDSGSNVDRS